MSYILISSFYKPVDLGFRSSQWRYEQNGDEPGGSPKQHNPGNSLTFLLHSRCDQRFQLKALHSVSPLEHIFHLKMEMQERNAPIKQPVTAMSEPIDKQARTADLKNRKIQSKLIDHRYINSNPCGTK